MHEFQMNLGIMIAVALLKFLMDGNIKQITNIYSTTLFVYYKSFETTKELNMN